MNTRTVGRKISHFFYDFEGKKIYGSKQSFAKAAKGSGALYDELISMMENMPDFECEVRDLAKKPKRAYKGLNRAFIVELLDALENSDSLKKKFDSVEKVAKLTKEAVFPQQKSWLFKECGVKEGYHFDMVAAKDAIAKFKASGEKTRATSLVKKDSEESNSAESNIIDIASATTQRKEG